MKLLADEMQLPVGSLVFHSRLLHFENEQPVQIEERACESGTRARICAAGLHDDHAESVPDGRGAAATGRVPHRSGGSLRGETRRSLAMKEHEPCLLLHRRTWSRCGGVGGESRHSGRPLSVHRALLMKLIRGASLVPKPWKNGGGVTREIDAEPNGAALDAFTWRLSIANVDDPGVLHVSPVSIAPGPLKAPACISRSERPRDA